MYFNSYSKDSMKQGNTIKRQNKHNNIIGIIIMLSCSIILMILLVTTENTSLVRLVMIILIFVSLINAMIFVYGLYKDKPKLTNSFDQAGGYGQKYSTLNTNNEAINKEILQKTSDTFENFNSKQKTISNSDNEVTKRLSFGNPNKPQPEISSSSIIMTTSQKIPAPNLLNNNGRSLIPNGYPSQTTTRKSIRNLSIPRSFDNNPRSKSFYDNTDTRPDCILSAPIVRGTLTTPAIRRASQINLGSYGAYNTQNSLNFEDPLAAKLENLFELRKNKAYIKLNELRIEREFAIWNDSIQKWFINFLLPHVIQQNLMNFEELNKSLLFYGRKLVEYENINQELYDKNMIYSQDNFIMTTIDDLLKYEENLNRGYNLWNCPYSIKKDELHKNQNHLRDLIQKRQDLESFLQIEGYSIYDNRVYILERAIIIKDSFLSKIEYKNIESTKRKKPTDIEILANFFFKYICTTERLGSKQENEITRLFILPTNFKPYLNMNNQAVYFQKSTTDSSEYHYDIYYNGESWPIIPGKENLFGAIAIFIYLIKTKKQGLLGNEYNPELQNLFDIIAI